MADYLSPVCVAVLISALAANTSSGAWIEVDDFEDGFGFTGAPVTLADNNQSPSTNNGWLVEGVLSSASRQVLTDPDSMYPENEVLAIIGGAGLGVIKPGSLSIADGTTATVFFRFRFQSTASSGKPTIGVSINDAGIATSGSGATIQIGNDSANYRLRSYNPANQDITNHPDPLPDAWYSMWMVVHNNDTPANDTVEFYLQRDNAPSGDAYENQVQLTWTNNGNPDPQFRFRTNKSTTLDDFFFRTNAGHASSRTIYFDDINYWAADDGVELGTPVPEPSSFVIAIVCLASWGWIRRRS